MKHFALRLPDDLMAWVRQEADRQERSINSQIIMILKQARGNKSDQETINLSRMRETVHTK